MTTTTPATSAPPPRASKKSWLIGLPIALIAVAALAWLLLAGLPFGGDEPRSTPQPQVETVTEGTATTSTTAGNTTMLDGRIEELTGTDTTSINTTTTSAAPPMTAPTMTASPSAAPPMSDFPGETATQAPPAASPRPAPPVTRTPRPAPPRPAPATQTPPPAGTPPPATMPPSRTEPATEPAQSSSPSGEISVSDAMSTLRSYVTNSNYYRIDTDCIAVNNLGYKNVGYTLEVRDRCEDRGLGRWRVDSKTREVFRQQGDGRYVRP